jgi:hypothetical protein
MVVPKKCQTQIVWRADDIFYDGFVLKVIIQQHAAKHIKPIVKIQPVFLSKIIIVNISNILYIFLAFYFHLQILRLKFC